MLLQTIREFLAPLIGCALIAVILTAPLTHAIGIDPGTAAKVSVCFSEVIKTHPGPWEPNRIAIVPPLLTDDIAFTFDEQGTGKVWDAQCTFDGWDRLTSTTAVPYKP
jgi:hypothetical protein